MHTVSNRSPYYFQKNLQGDVIRICNVNGDTVVQYTYDAWGKVLSVTGTLASTVGQINPFRYRGYYYDFVFSLSTVEQQLYHFKGGRWPALVFVRYDQWYSKHVQTTQNRI